MNEDTSANQRSSRIEEIKDELRELRRKLSLCTTNAEMEFRITELEDELEDLKKGGGSR
jgi:DNA repair exonuclease SbcCD ATPase subunit